MELFWECGFAKRKVIYERQQQQEALWQMKNKNIVYGVLISYLNVLISIIYGFVSVPILLKALGKSEYGVYSTIASLIGYMSIMDFGIHNVLVRYLTKYRVQKDRKAYENLLAVSLVIYSAISGILFVIGYYMYQNLGSAFGNSFSVQELEIARKIFWIVLLDLILSLPGAIFQCVINAEEHFIFGRSVLGIKQIAKLVLVIAVAELGGKSFALVCTVFALNISVIICQALYAWTRLHMRIHLYEWKWKYIYSLFVYTFFVFIASVADQILWKLDSVILGMKVSAEVVAVYAVAMNLVTIYKKFSGAVSGIFLPRATAMSITDSSEEASVRLMTKVGVIQFLILSLALIGFGIVGQEFLLVWLGDGYEEVYVIFLILAFSLMIPSCQSIGINILEARNKHKFRAVVCCILAVVNGVFTYLVVPKYGMIGAASCTAGAVILGQVLILNIYYKVALHLNIVKFFIDTFLRFLLPVSLAGAAAWWFASKLSMYGSWMSLCIKAILVMAVYVAVIIVTVGKRLNGIYHIVNRKGR